MAHGDPCPLRIGCQIGILRKLFQQRRLWRRHFALGKGDPVKQAGNRFGDRADIVQLPRPMGARAKGAAPALILSFEIHFGDALALILHQHSVQTGKLPRLESPGNRSVQHGRLLCQSRAQHTGSRKKRGARPRRGPHWPSLYSRNHLVLSASIVPSSFNCLNGGIHRRYKVLTLWER